MPKSITLILDNIRSLYNVGAIFRSADAFSVEKIYLCGYTAYPLGDLSRPDGSRRQMDRLKKTALGAEESVPWERQKDALSLIKKLKERGVFVAALEMCDEGVDISECTLNFPIALIIGNETSGISKEILEASDVVVSIPMLGKKESLNASVAASVLIYEIRTRKK